ncbi:hypothetical protein WA577_002995, partial [Blastocystis sp. JDR]
VYADVQHPFIIGDPFYECSRVVFENLPELTSILTYNGAFDFKRSDESSELILRNLPKLTSLVTKSLFNLGFTNPYHVVLENMPSLTTVTLSKDAFSYRDTIVVNNVGALMNDPTLPHSNPNVNVHTRDELMSLSSSITQLIVDCDCCNEEDLSLLNICQWPLLSVIEI